jgi:moderate conductance mechanosensitive channel
MTAIDVAPIWTAITGFYEAGGWPLKTLVIIAVAVVIRFILQFVIRRVVNRIVSGVKKKHQADDTQALQNSPLMAVRIVQRTRTLGSVLSNILTAVIVVVAILLIVNAINTNLTGAFSLITAALGAGLGFGAQNIIKDVLNGLFMVGEDQLGVGDVVDTNFATGVVEHVGIRVTQIRDVNGTLWYVRNGEIQRVGNMSQGWARVIIDLAVPYDSDVDAVEERMLKTANDLAADAKWRTRILERPEIWGLESISAEAIVIRLVVKTRSGTKDDVARELRARLKRALDEMGVRLPALNSIMLSGFEGATSVRGARPPKTRPITVPPSEELKASTRKASRKNG